MKKINSYIVGLSAILTATPAFAVTMVPYSTQSVAGIVEKIITWALTFAGALAVLFIIYGGLMYITASGAKDKLDKAKKTLTWAIIGLIIVVLSNMIVGMVINTVSGNFLSSATDDGTETVAEASVLTPELEARVQQVSPTEESTVAAQEEEEANARVESVNNNEGENVDSTDPEPGNESNNESTEKEALGEFAPLVDLTKDFLLKNNLIDTAEASSSGIITDSITFGSSGKYTLLKDSGAATYKQYDSRWASKKYGLKKNSRGTNVCSTFKEAACAPSAIANAVSKYVNKTPESVGNRIKDRYPSYRNNYTSGSPCKSGTKSDAIADVGSDYLTSSNYVIKTAKLGWSDAKRAIDSNYPVIFKTTNSNFTSGGHYLVIRGKIKRKSDGKIFYWLSDSGPRNIKAATEAEITRGNGGYWKTYRSSARVVSNFETLYI